MGPRVSAGRRRWVASPSCAALSAAVVLTLIPTGLRACRPRCCQAPRPDGNNQPHRTKGMVYISPRKKGFRLVPGLSDGFWGLWTLIPAYIKKHFSIYTILMYTETPTVQLLSIRREDVDHRCVRRAEVYRSVAGTRVHNPQNPATSNPPDYSFDLRARWDRGHFGSEGAFGG